MITVLLIIALMLSSCISGAAGYVAYRAIIKNFELQDRHKDYNRFHTIILDALEEDTQFMRTELVKKLSIEIPENRALNGGIIKFQNRLEVIRATLKEYKMIEE